MGSHRFRTKQPNAADARRRAEYASREHRQTRAAWQRRIDAGPVPCTRCGQAIVRGMRWHLDHTDDRAGYRGPSHAACNLRAAAKAGNRAQKARLRPIIRAQSRAW